MKLQTREWSTPLMIGSSVIISVTGIMLFFHMAEGLIKAAHEWIGVAFVAVIVLHVLNHWKPFKSYFHRQRAQALMLGTVLIAAGFVLSADNGPHPMKMVDSVIEHSSVSAIATLQQRPVDELRHALESEGLVFRGNEQSLAQISEDNGVDLIRLIELLFNQQPSGSSLPGSS